MKSLNSYSLEKECFKKKVKTPQQKLRRKKMPPLKDIRANTKKVSDQNASNIENQLPGLAEKT